MRRIIILLFISVFFIPKSYTQEYYELEELFLDANSWFTYEDYKEALPLFLRVLEADSLNYNVMYKIGYCYLNIPGQKQKAIPYLENAIKKTTPNYRDNTYAEYMAPVDALFYLGNAYLVNNRIDEAIDAYTGFQTAIKRTKRLANKDIYDLEYLERQFDACRSALQLEYDPVNFLARNVGAPINTRFNEFNAVVSGDGSTLVYTSSLQFYDAIFYSKKENGQWSAPINIMGQLGVDDKAATTGLSYDGTELYIYRDDNLDGNIYVSFLEDGIWSRVRKLGENINTKYWESHASLSPDGEKLYFVSNREGGYGDLDIYVSERLGVTIWGDPVNLGNVINTRWNENSPFLTPDGKRLFFSSEGHKGMGGYDIFYSELKDGKWTEPVNIGYPINTTDNDVFFVPFEGGQFVYCSQFSKKGFGLQDIYQFHLFDLPGYNNFLVEGVVEMDNEVDRNKKDFKINIIDKTNKDTLSILRPDTDIMSYQTPLGKNHLVYESTLNEKSGQQFYISAPYDIKEVFLDSIYNKQEKELALEEKDTLPHISVEQKSFVTETAKENVKIKLSLQKGDKLIVETYYKGELINSEEFKITKSDFVYEYKPLLGESKIKFKLVDKNNNVKSQEVTVSYLPKDTEAELSIAEKIVQLNPDGSKNVKIRLIAEKGSKLSVETYVDGKLINTETFKIKREDFTYEFEPEGDKTKLNFSLVDKHNNIKNEEIIISHKPISNELANAMSGINTYNNKEFEKVINSAKVKNSADASELINNLYSKATSMGLAKEQVQMLIVALAANLTDNTPEFVDALYSLAKGEMKTVLADIKANKQNYNSNMEVIEELRLKSKTHDYTVEDIISLLELYITQSGIPVDELISKLEMFINQNISGILTNIDVSAIDLTTLDEFKQYLVNKGTYSAEELKTIFDLLDAAALVNSKYDVEIELTEILNDAKLFKNNEFKEILNSLDIDKAISSESLINKIYDQSESGALSKEQAQALILTLAMNSTSNTFEFIEKLSELARGGLKVVLDDIKANKNNYKSNLQVIEELRSKSKKYNYTIDDVIRLLEDYIKQSGLPADELIKTMQQILDMNIPAILSDIDVSKLGITDLEGLREYLINQHIYTKEQIDYIISFVEAITLINSKAKPQPEPVSVAIEKRSNYNGLITIIIAGLVLLVIFIIYFNRRKNKANKKRNI